MAEMRNVTVHVLLPTQSGLSIGMIGTMVICKFAYHLAYFIEESYRYTGNSHVTEGHFSPLNIYYTLLVKYIHFSSAKLLLMVSSFVEWRHFGR